MPSLLARYSRLLKNRPILTNSVVAATLFASGDVIAQWISPDEIAFDRVLRNALYGGIIFGPIAARMYPYLAKHVHFPRKANVPASNFKDTTVRVVVDQIVWAPFGIALYMSCMGLMQSTPIDDIKKGLKQGWWSTVTANWTVWPLVQMVNFAFVPVEHRVIVVSIVGVFWNAYLSMKSNKSGL